MANQDSTKPASSNSTAKAASATKTPKSKLSGASFRAYFVEKDQDPYSQVKWTKRSSAISDTTGGKVFSAEGVEVPEGWSQLATDIAVSKYFRRAGVPASVNGTGGETSVKQLVHRVAHTIAQAGRNGGYGNWVMIRHADGWATGYGHMSRFAPGMRSAAH